MRFMAGLDDLGSFLSWMNLSRAEEMDSSPVCVLPGRQLELQLQCLHQGYSSFAFKKKIKIT